MSAPGDRRTGTHLTREAVALLPDAEYRLVVLDVAREAFRHLDESHGFADVSTFISTREAWLRWATTAPRGEAEGSAATLAFLCLRLGQAAAEDAAAEDAAGFRELRTALLRHLAARGSN